MNSILLASAGRTTWDEEGRLVGSRSLPLSTQGRQAMQQIAGQLHEIPVSVIYTGHSRYCLESARILAQGSRVPVKCLDAFAEVNQGVWEGLRLAELEHQYARAYRTWLHNPAAICPPHGENLVHAYERVRSALATLARRHRGQLIGIVAPRLLGALIQCCLRGLGVESVWQIYREDVTWEILPVPDSFVGRA